MGGKALSPRASATAAQSFGNSGSVHGNIILIAKQDDKAVPAAFGLASSTVSRRYIRASAQRLKDLLGRRLEGCDFVAKKAFDVPPGLMAVYITHVLAYSTDREIRRWIHVSWSPKPRGQKLMALKRNG